MITITDQEERLRALVTAWLGSYPDETALDPSDNERSGVMREMALALDIDPQAPEDMALMVASAELARLVRLIATLAGRDATDFWAAYLSARQVKVYR